MKKLVMLVFLVLVVIMLSFVYAQTCSDSDGKNYYIQGSAIDENSSFQDRCIDEKILEEGLCDANQVFRITYVCPNGCSNGACLCPVTKCENGIIYGPENCKVEDNVCICPSCPAPRPTIICTIPTCSGASNTGKLDENNCPIYACPALATAGGGGISAPTKICTDSDNGNFYEKGIMKGATDDTGHWDSCGDSKILTEYYCENNEAKKTTYSCPEGCKDGACLKNEEVSEKVICGFKNSPQQEQKCYTAYINDRAYCSGIGTCIAEIKGYRGEQITWKSSCGEYQYTTMDGNDEKIEFECKSGETTITEVKNKGFRYAYFQCYDGAESKSIGREACKSAEYWKKFAENFCQAHCKKYGDVEKCGINSFSIGKECYIEETVSEAVAVQETIPTVPAIPTTTTEKPVKEEPILVCRDSCPLDGKCYPFGYRKSGKYCSDEGRFIEQKTSEETCDNNFECSSNVCVSGKCISSSLIDKIISWFKKLFGRE